MTSDPNPSETGQSAGMDPQLLKAAIQFNTLILGVTCGITAALVLFASTHISLAYWGEDAGGYLGLLGVFFPGYDVSPSGAVIGSLWAFVFAGLAGGLTYGLYGRLLGERLASEAFSTEGEAVPMINPATLRLAGVPLGIAIGAAVGLALFASTSWLILRGTADSSIHASLLSNYLPGYSVSYGGGLLGALEMFAFVFLCCVLLAAIYNKLVSLRSTDSR